MSSLKRWTYGWLALAAALLVLDGQAVGEDGTPTPPWADEYFARQDTRQYLIDAEAFLQANADSPYAPVVAFEAMMVASIHEREDVLEAMRGKLLFDHPESLQSQFVFSTLDAAKYAEFLEDDLDFDVLADSEACERRLAGIAAAYQKWKEEIFKDSTVALKVAIIAQRHGDYRLATVCERELTAKKEGDTAEIAAILFTRGISNADKLAQLSTRASDDKKARIVRRLLFHGLSAEERRDPAMQAIALADFMRESQWSEALVIANEYIVAKPNDCRARYWRAWALSGQCKNEEALLAAKSLQTDFPDDPWARAATTLIEGIESQQATLDSYLALKEFFAARPGQLRSLEAWGQFPTGGHNIEAYIAGSIEDHHLEAVLKLDSNVVFAYRTSNSKSALFSLGDSTIQAANAPGHIPFPKLKIGDVDLHGIDVNYEMAVSTKEVDTRAAFQDAKKELDKLVVDRETMEVLFLRTQVRGQLGLPVKFEDDGALIRVATACMDQPGSEVRELKVVAAEDGYRASIDLPDGIAFRFHLATSSDHKFNPPAWPDIPVREQDEIDIAALIRSGATLWQAFAALESEKNSEKPNTAAAPVEVK
jgi:hypothetical protein